MVSGMCISRVHRAHDLNIRCVFQWIERRCMVLVGGFTARKLASTSHSDEVPNKVQDCANYDNNSPCSHCANTRFLKILPGNSKYLECIAHARRTILGTLRVRSRVSQIATTQPATPLDAGDTWTFLLIASHFCLNSIFFSSTNSTWKI